jgi:hypothetical protein
MGLPARFALLVAAISLMPLPTPHFRPAFRTAVALATVAADADCECGPAGRAAANPKPENSVLVDNHMDRPENYDTVERLQ